jgi:hypothetical protein
MDFNAIFTTAERTALGLEDRDYSREELFTVLVVAEGVRHSLRERRAELMDNEDGPSAAMLAELDALTHRNEP